MPKKTKRKKKKKQAPHVELSTDDTQQAVWKMLGTKAM
jgi:hypothetical protein